MVRHFFLPFLTFSCLHYLPLASGSLKMMPTEKIIEIPSPLLRCIKIALYRRGIGEYSTSFCHACCVLAWKA